MASDLKIRFYSNFLLSFWWMQMCLATLRPLKFFSPNVIFNWKRRIFISKEKKEKKESHSSSGGFQKSKFFLKNTTTLIRPLEVGICCLVEKLFWKRMGGGDFLKNPQGLNLLFCKPGTYLCSLFFILFFWFLRTIFLSKSDFFVSEFGSSCEGFKFWGWSKNKKSIINAFVRNRNLKLLLHCLIFCGAWKCSVCRN